MIMRLQSFFLPVVTAIFRRKRIIVAALLLLIIIITFYLKRSGYLTIEGMISFLGLHPLLAPLVFILFYSLMVVLLMSTFPLNLGAGFLWGPFWGGLITIISVSIGGLVAFLISRYLAYDYLSNKFKKGIWASLNQEIQKNNWKIVAFTRINPVFPFGLVSYFLGLTDISFKKYFWATVVFVSPVIFVVAFIGSLIGGFVLRGKSYGLFYDVSLAILGLTFLIALYFVLKRYFRIKKDKEKTNDKNDALAV